MHKREDKSTEYIRTWIYIVVGGAALPAIVCFVGYFGFVHPLKSYISSKPWPIDHINISKDAEIDVLVKIKAFSFTGRSGDSLIFSSEDINHLIRNNVLVQRNKVKYHIMLEDSLFNIKCNVNVDEVKTHLSWFIRLFGFEGYVNTEIEGYLRYHENKLMIVTTRSQLGGKQAPFTLLGKRTHIDIGDFFSEKASYESFIHCLHAVTIKNNQMIFLRK